MDLANLSAFVAIAQSGSFSAAGEALHLTQPAVSKRIALLEGQLSARLFDRLGRQVVLTEAGQALLPRAQRILTELEDTRRVLEHLGAAVCGRLSLATSHHVGLHRLPALLRRFAAEHPQAALDIQFMDSELAYAAVLRGEVELAVTTLAPDTRAPLRAQPIWHDRLQFVVAPDHPLAAVRAVTLNDVVTHPAVLPDPGTFTHRIVAGLFAERGLVTRVRMSTNYLETIKMLVSVGLAWSVLPERMIDHQIVALPLADVALSRVLGCVTHGGRTLSRAAQAFVALLNAQAEQLQG
ncbi:LysR family transcriptional regulator [Xanthomonas populi]|uniref:LysR family transcriptional regulator n=1 Tax=Xanthomonas populi TaxID=53414 RepID=A0A2S7F0Y7_9XANT|nr:LysR family transcriptional regulator [Xanthomonas populi]PPU99107.1 LysR family transcriptional regulator [Xanthomonas populi]